MTDAPDPAAPHEAVDKAEEAAKLLKPDVFHVGGGVRHVIDWDGGIGTCPFCRGVYYCCRCNNF